jgi:hypothetical protein
LDDRLCWNNIVRLKEQRIRLGNLEWRLHLRRRPVRGLGGRLRFNLRLGGGLLRRGVVMEAGRLHFVKDVVAKKVN